MMDRKYELGHEKIGRLLIRYSTPAMIAMIVNSTYNLVDTIFVGRGVGTLALAGLAVTFPVPMFILGMAQVVGTGSASIISRNLGAGNTRKAERTAGASFATVAVFSLVLTVLGLLFLGPLVRLFGASPLVAPYAYDYLFIILSGTLFYAFAASSNNIVRSEGNARVAMVSMLIGGCTNLILDPIFIFVLHMGVRGAAIATVISQICSCCFLCSYFLSGKSLLHIRRADLKPDFTILPEVVTIGFPAFTRVSAGAFLAIVLNNSVQHYGTETHLAFVGVFNRVATFAIMPIIGVVQGLQPIIGFNYGARNAKRVKEAVRKAVGLATAIATFAFLVLMVFPGPILRLFSEDPVLIGEGVRLIRVLILMLPFVGFQIIGASFFQAVGKAGPATFLSMSRQVLFLIPLLLALPLHFHLAGIWMAIPLSDFLSTSVTGVWLFLELSRLSRRLGGRQTGLS